MTSAGGDPCEYANDGACDVPQYCSSGDWADCGSTPSSSYAPPAFPTFAPQFPTAVPVSQMTSAGGDPCEYANDGACDVPQYCSSGDWTDCGAYAPPMQYICQQVSESAACSVTCGTGWVTSFFQ